MVLARLFAAILLLAGLLGWTQQAQEAQRGSQSHDAEQEAAEEGAAAHECFLSESGVSAEFPFLKKGEGEELIRLAGKSGIYLSASAGANWYCRRTCSLNHSEASLLSTPSLQLLETRLQI